MMGLAPPRTVRTSFGVSVWLTCARIESVAGKRGEVARASADGLTGNVSSTVQREWTLSPRGLTASFVITAVCGLILWITGRELVASCRLRGACDECGYDLTGAAAQPAPVCPECGRRVPVEGADG